MGIGDWGLGILDWAQSAIPNPQSPIPNKYIKQLKIINISFIILKKYYLIFLTLNTLIILSFKTLFI